MLTYRNVSESVLRHLPRNRNSVDGSSWTTCSVFDIFIHWLKRLRESRKSKGRITVIVCVIFPNNMAANFRWRKATSLNVRSRESRWLDDGQTAHCRQMALCLIYNDLHWKQCENFAFLKIDRKRSLNLHLVYICVVFPMYWEWRAWLVT
jgi:hypothetical protein